MNSDVSALPISVSLGGLNERNLAIKEAPVNKRVLYLGIQAVFNAIFIGLIAKCLIYLIDLITNLSFYGIVKGSIMTEKIKRPGITTPDAYEPDILRTAKVSGLFKRTEGRCNSLPHINETDDVGFAAEMMGKYNTDVLLVLESKKSQIVSGLITSAAILSFYSQQKQKELEYQSPGKTCCTMVQGRKIFLKNRPSPNS